MVNFTIFYHDFYNPPLQRRILPTTRRIGAIPKVSAVGQFWQVPVRAGQNPNLDLKSKFKNLKNGKFYHNFHDFPP